MYIQDSIYIVTASLTVVANGLHVCMYVRYGVCPTLACWVVTILHHNTNPFVVLDIPEEWCVGSVRMDFNTDSVLLTPSINIIVHNMTQMCNKSHTVQAMSVR